MAEAWIVDAVRTPVGRAGGALSSVRPDDLAALALGRLLERTQVAPDQIEDVLLGCANQAGEDNRNVARMALLLAGWPESVPGVTVNRLCGSGMEAVAQAARAIAAGEGHAYVAGGVESMSRVPMASDGGAWFLDPETNDATSFVPQGIGADLIATIEGFSRADVDAYALGSQEKAAKAWAGGHFARSVVPVADRNGVPILERDEHVRPDTTLEGLAALPSAFAGIGDFAGFDAVALQKYHWVEAIDHVHTAGNSSGIVDGASVLLIGSEQAGRELGLVSRARIVATATTGSDPTIMLTGPTPATRKVLATAGLDLADIDLFEINEAFAAVVLKYVKDLGLPEDRVNVNGGAIAMVHPLGATGALLLGTVIDELERRDARRGLVTLCIGGGMGVATIVERA